MEINKKMYNNNNPWLYVNYSMLIPGLGQVIGGKLKRGIIFFVVILVFMLISSFLLISPYVSSEISIMLLIATFIVYLWNISNSLKITEKRLCNSSQQPKEKNPWIGVFLSQILPPLGLFYSNKWLLGILTIVLLFLLNILVKSMILFAIIRSILIVTVCFTVFRLLTSKKTRDTKHILRICIIIFALNTTCISTAVYIKNNIISTSVLVGSSMEPTLNKNSYILVSKYDKDQIKRGDIVLYKTKLLDKDKRLVHRVIAFEGERVEIRNSHILVNDQIVYGDIQVIEKGKFGVDGNVFIVPENSIFVLGDNSEKSIDSRFLGEVPKENIIGKYIKTIWKLPGF